VHIAAGTITCSELSYKIDVKATMKAKEHHVSAYSTMIEQHAELFLDISNWCSKCCRRLTKNYKLLLLKVLRLYQGYKFLFGTTVTNVYGCN